MKAAGGALRMSTDDLAPVETSVGELSLRKEIARREGTGRRTRDTREEEEKSDEERHEMSIIREGRRGRV